MWPLSRINPTVRPEQAFADSSEFALRDATMTGNDPPKNIRMTRLAIAEARRLQASGL
jgi:hypothetical protein